MKPVHIISSRRQFLASATMTLSAGLIAPSSFAWTMEAEAMDSRVAKIVAGTIGIDTHNHIDVSLTADEMPGSDLDLKGEMKRSGLAAICMTFATDYQSGNAYERFENGLASMDRQLQRNGMKRSLTPADIRAAHQRGEPTVVQAVEGAHFLQGRLERVEEAYHRGLRHFGLLHDSDASVPLGDVYTNPPQFGGLTAFGTAVVKECNRLGVLIDLAHADVHTTAMALKVSTRPLVISHTGLDTQLGTDTRIAQAMRPRLIGKEQARAVASAGGAVGVWTHLADTPLEYAKNIRALVDVIGVDHVCLGTDTKLTPSNMDAMARPFGGDHRGPDGPHPDGPPRGGSQGQGHGPQHARLGDRTNAVWPDQGVGFYYVVVDAMLKTGFTPEEIGKIGGGNYLRIFGQVIAS